jgi:putative membrane protein insertion efficiency factor
MVDADRWAPRAARPRSLAARPLHALIRLYQRMTAARPSPCRYDPTCSSYALDALEGHGAARGAWLATRRLCRCHPWGGQGWDPVPPPRPPRARKGSPRA